jgi:ribosomal protein S18 acetylase RimI-like enzyme
MLRIIQVESDEELSRARTLIEEYAASLNVDLCFQDFDVEKEHLATMYGKPTGALFVATMDGDDAGCVGVRALAPGVAEMKRWFVRPRYQKFGIGKTLLDAAIRFARDAGYDEIRLDTLPSMSRAIALYRSTGFVEIAPYRHNPVPGSLFFSLHLHQR